MKYALSFIIAIFFFGCRADVPEIPVRETLVPVSVSIFMNGKADNSEPRPTYMERMRNDMLRTRMAVAVQPGEPSQLLLHVRMGNGGNTGTRVSWEVTDHRQKVVLSGVFRDSMWGTGLDEQMVSSIVLSKFSELDLQPFKNAPAIIFIRDELKVVEAKPTKEKVRRFPKSKNLGENDYAVIIGIENYREEFEPVHHAENDARQFEGLLQQSFNIPAENIKTLVNERATKSDIVAALFEWLPARATKDSRVFVFFSGYGSPGQKVKTPKKYLLPYDGTPSYLETGGVALDVVENHIGSLKSKNAYLFLDTSFSGNGEKSISPKGLRPLVPKEAFTHSPAIVFSNAQAAHIFKEKKHGLFTHLLLSGLSGDADENADKSIDISEIKNYLEVSLPEVAKNMGKEQNIAFRSPENKLDVVLINELNISGQ